MPGYSRNESVKEIARLCERFFESLESGAKPESVAERFRNEYVPLALQKIEEEPHNANMHGRALKLLSQIEKHSKVLTTVFPNVCDMMIGIEIEN